MKKPSEDRLARFLEVVTEHKLRLSVKCHISGGCWQAILLDASLDARDRIEVTGASPKDALNGLMRIVSGETLIALRVNSFGDTVHAGRIKVPNLN